MGLTPFKGLLFLSGAVIAGAGAAYLAGAFDPYLKERPALLVATPEAPEAGGGEAAAPAPAEEAGQKTARLQEGADAPEGTVEEAAEAEMTVPSFDVVRVEPDGSTVVAGRAAPNATVEIIHGSTVLGTATSGPTGDFAAVLETPLKPGDYQIVLRATTPDNLAATSVETAIVTVPDNEAGQVLALVDRPGAPSRLITVPEAAPGASPAARETPPAQQPAAEQSAPAEQPASGPAQTAAGEADPGAPAQAEAPAAPPVASAAEPAEAAVPNIEAVEIDGRQIFVAGAAKPGRTVRVYANEILLGEAVAEPNGRFLIEAQRELPVGDYIVRADMLSADRLGVEARAAVPFTRAEGEQIAAVAPKVESLTKTDRLPAEAPAAGAPKDEAAKTTAAAAPAAAPSAAAKLAPVDGSVIIRRGDTLWHISRRVYGRGIRYTTIYLANREQIENPDRIWPGQVFAVPEKTEEGEAADLDAIGEQAAPVDPSAAPQQ